MKNAQRVTDATSRGAWNKIKDVALNARALLVLTGIGISALLAACGGGGQEFVSTQTQPAPAVQQVSEKSPEGNPFAQTPVLTSTVPEVMRMKALAVNAPTASPYGEATQEDAVNQLLDFAEKSYSQYFPTKKENQTFFRYTYRYYPETGVYVGVATNVASSDGLMESGVYVMGGPFGEAPTYVGQLNQFITPYKVAHYTDMVYTIWTGKQIFSTVKNSDGTFTVAKVKNVSQYQIGFYPLFNCGMYTKAPLPDGKILINCTVAVDTVRRFFAIDPMKQELDEYSGTVPEPLTSENWVFVQGYDPNKPEWGAKAKTTEGWYYRTATNVATLLFADNSGNVSVAKAGTFATDGDIAAILSFSN